MQMQKFVRPNTTANLEIVEVYWYYLQVFQEIVGRGGESFIGALDGLTINLTVKMIYGFGS
jgi:hypothetical protein